MLVANIRNFISKSILESNEAPRPFATLSGVVSSIFSRAEIRRSAHSSTGLRAPWSSAKADKMLKAPRLQDQKSFVYRVISTASRFPYIILFVLLFILVFLRVVFVTNRNHINTVTQSTSLISPTLQTVESNIGPIETEIWNTDTDSLEELSFKYPKEWKITYVEPGRIVSLNSWFLPYNRDIEIAIEDNPNHLSIQDFLLQDLGNFLNEELLSGIQVEPFTGKTISGIKTVEIPEGISNILEVFIARYRDKILEITLLSGGEIGGKVGVPVAQEDERVFLQIIDSIENSRQVTPHPAPPGWQTYSDEQLGFSIQYPTSWYKFGLSKSSSFKGKCFGDNSEGPMYSTADFCVDLNPWVRPSSLEGNASNASEAQQEFFQELASREVGQPLVVNTNQYTVVRHFEIAGSPAIERIETDAPGTEGYEPSHIVAVYINHPTLGLIRLTMGAFTREEFEQHEDVLRQILDSFIFLK